MNTFMPCVSVAGFGALSSPAAKPEAVFASLGALLLLDLVPL